MVATQTPDLIFWWKSGSLFHAQRGGLDPSTLYTSTDLPDALEQVGFRDGIDVIRPNEAPDLETEIWT